MPDSDITVTSLTITPGSGHNLAKFAYTDPNANGLPSLKLDAVELWAATSNDRAHASFVKVDEGRDKAAHMGVVEGSTYYYWAKASSASGRYGDYYPSGATSGVIGTVGFAAGAAQALINGKITATVAANVVTVRIKTLSGDDPSSINPVFVGFRGQDGSYVVRSITAALSLVISAGSSLGANSGTPVRLWLVAFDDAAVVKLAAVNCCSGFGVLPLDEVGTASATAEGGAGGADTLGVFYATAAITAKQFRILGFIEWTSIIVTAGQYPNAPNIIHVAGPATKFPGALVQTVSVYSASQTNGVVAIPVDNTIPQISEGSEATSYSGFVPKSPCNVIKTEFRLHAARSTAGPLIAAAFSSLSNDSLHTTIQAAVADALECLVGDYGYMALNTTSRDYSLRGGASGGATYYLNSNSGGGYFGGTLLSKMTVTEIAG